MSNKDDSGIQGSESKELEVNKDPNFIGEFANMDLTPLKDKTFFIAVRTGDPEKGKFLPTTIKGPYDFYEMAEEVGTMWRDHQHHACAYFASKDRNAKNKFLDKNSIDYIEASFEDIVTDGLLTGAFDEDFDCLVGINEIDDDDHLLKVKDDH